MVKYVRFIAIETSHFELIFATLYLSQIIHFFKKKKETKKKTLLNREYSGKKRWKLQVIVFYSEVEAFSLRFI